MPGGLGPALGGFQLSGLKHQRERICLSVPPEGSGGMVLILQRGKLRLGFAEA